MALELERARPRRRSELLWVALVMVGLGLVWTAHAWTHPASVIVGSHGHDGYQAIWFLDWSAFALAHGHNPLLTNFAFYPSGANLMWNTSIPLAGMALSPVTWLFGPIASYNVVVTLGPALSGWCAYVAFRRWTNPLPALAGAVVFGFGPFVVNAVAYETPNLICVASAPLLLIVFDRVASGEVRSPLRLGVALGVVLAAQLLLCEEVLAIEVVTLVTAAVVVGIIGHAKVRSRWPDAVRVGGVGGLIFIVLAAWPLGTQFLGPNRLSATIHVVTDHDADLVGFALPNPSAYPLHDQIFQFVHGNGDAGVSLGVPLLVLLLIAVIMLRRHAFVRILATIMVIIGAFSLGAVLMVAGRARRSWVPLPWRLFSNQPLLRDLFPSRFGVMLDLLAGLLLACLLHSLRHRKLWTRAFIWTLAVLALVTIVHVPFAPVRISKPATFVDQGVCRSGETTPPIVVVLPFYAEQAMTWQAESGFCFKMPSGWLISTATMRQQGHVIAYFGPQVRPVLDVMSKRAGTGLRLPRVTPEIRRQVRAELDHPRTSAVALGPSSGEATLSRWLTSVLGRPVREGTALVWFRNSRW